MRSDDKQTTGQAVRDGILLGVVLLTIAAAEANGDEHYSSSAPGSNTNANARPLSTPQLAPSILSRGTSFSETLADGIYSEDLFSVPMDPSAPRFSATDFRPRKRTVFDADPAAAVYTDTPMLRGTTVWQRMNDYRSRDRVRLLTLWESSGSILSLQAGKRGDPSLQWTSTSMNRGGATRGLLDKLFSVSIASAGETFHNVTHSKSTVSKPGSQPTIADFK